MCIRDSHKSVTINSKLMILVSISMFSGARNTLRPYKMTLDHYVRCKSSMASNTAANTSMYSTVHSDLMIFVSLLSFLGHTATRTPMDWRHCWGSGTVPVTGPGAELLFRGLGGIAPPQMLKAFRCTSCWLLPDTKVFFFGGGIWFLFGGCPPKYA